MFQDLRKIWRNEFFKNVATLISGTTLAQGVSVLIYIVLSRIYTDEDFGIFGLYMNILNITIIFSTAKYELAILLPKSDRESVNLVGLSGLVSMGVSLLLLMTVLLLNRQICGWLGSEEISAWLYYIPLSTLLVGFFQTLRNYSNREKRYKLIAGANIAQSLGNSLLKVLLGLLVMGAAGLIFGVVFGQALGLLIFLVVHFRRNSSKWSWIKIPEMKRLAREYSLFPRYNMWQGLVNNLSGALPVFIFSSYFSLAVAGIYTFGYMLVYRPVNLVAGAFYQVLYQRFSEKINHGKSILPELRLFLRQTASWLLIPFVIFGIFAPDIFAFIFEKAEAGRYAQLMLPWIFMVSLTMPLSFIPDLYKKQKTALFLDSIRLAGRIGALAAGVALKSVYLGLALYSGVSAVMILYSLAWYIRLVKKNQIMNNE